jgi:heme/copper-type cytochrome/quinol oxidase subunit 3
MNDDISQYIKTMNGDLSRKQKENKIQLPIIVTTAVGFIFMNVNIMIYIHTVNR